ncbi:hypothetical protein [Caenimonas aquaedulcis]|uniref:Uncharacterized protein n=1 Tax=Caenimonas aquaedulcis TaxID=2793270 RepID=A0A931H623_9BURK|nr:hypothetical protein [Caenimonas aquaedulcis]MBG9389122.1 hypothetical protein [Caenimonas aquaedulcis]
MTSFAHVDNPAEHPGLIRVERFATSVQNAYRSLSAPRAGASLLLAAIVAALVVVANQVIDTWTEGHLLAAWIVMWAVAFAALALLASPAKRFVAGSRRTVRRWSVARQQRIQDEKLWKVALTDARVMADISRAMSAGATRDVRTYY